MRDRKSSPKDGGNPSASGEAPTSPGTHPDGPLFATGQSVSAGAAETASPYPWDEAGEPEVGTEADTEATATDDLPQAERLFEPAADRSGPSSEGQRSAFERLNENIEQLLETVDAVAADVAESRSHLERTNGSGSDDPEAGSGADGIEERIRVHTADFHRWIAGDRRRRRWWPAVAAGIAAPAR